LTYWQEYVPLEFYERLQIMAKKAANSGAEH
jgi:hypothetical protein